MLPKLRNRIHIWLTQRSLGEVGPVIVLFCISILLCILNYSPGTWLSGWDTLHPEFNFGLSFERIFYGVFRIEQGLGAVAGHSHMADLPRIIILYLSHFFLPLSFLRYFYVFLNLILGALGMYFLLNKHFLKDKQASFLGALFYLLNVGTVQIFNVPFEMFTTLFATLPLIFYFAYSYLTENTHKTRSLLFFGVFSFLNSPSAYAATLWLVFFLGFLIYFSLFSLLSLKNHRNIFKKFIVLSLIMLSVNLYWLLPNLYFILNHGVEVAKANINILFSDQAFLKNKEFGNLQDLLLLKSFYFDWNIYQGQDSFTDLLGPYITHLKNLPVLIIAYLFGAGIIAGAIYLIKSLKKQSIPILALLIFCLVFLINSNFPLTPFFNFFQDHIPFFKEAFRFPGDKIFNIYVFLASIFFGYFALFTLKRLREINLRFDLVFTILALVLIIFYGLPSFSGNLINKYMRVNIPQNYFALFDYLKTQPKTARVANLPINSPWGWIYYNWFDAKQPSFQGAGFLYFGITQPLLDRDFDRWSPYNESYYREMSYALYSKNDALLKNVINKYKVGFVLIDKSVISPQVPNSALFFEDSKNQIIKTGLVKEEKQFGNIELLKLNVNSDITNSISANTNVSPQTTTTYRDVAYEMLGDYITYNYFDLNAGFGNIIYAFRDLINNNSKLHKDILTIDNEKITLNPLDKVENFDQKQILEDFNFIPADLVAEINNRNITLSFYPNAPVFDNTPLSSPIGTEILLGSAENLLLSINQNDIFNIGKLPQSTPIAIGKVLLKNDPNQVSVFDTDQTTDLERVSKIINPFFSSCEGDNDPPLAGFDDNGMQVKGKGDICILIPYGFFPSQSNDDLLTNFGFEYLGSARISSCLFSQGTSKCIYYRSPQRNGNLVTFPYVMPENQTGKTALKIMLEATNDNINSYNLAKLFGSYSKSVAKLTLPQNLVKDAYNKQNKITFNKIYLPKNIVYDPGFKITEVSKLDSDCNASGTNAKKEITSDNSGLKLIKYSSLVGTFCDHFSYQNLPHSEAYLIIVKSKNSEGLPLTLCATNYTSRRCDIYSNLTAYKNGGQDTFLLPPMDKDGIGYDINLSNLGIKNSPSVNYIESIEFIPIPYQLLQSINTPGNIPTNSINGKIETVKEYNPLFYVVQTNSTETIVNLNLSFEKGFRAYPISCNGNLSCFVKGSIAPFYAKELNSHVLVNNWSNGWIVDKPASPNSKIAIIFIPQYLEYFGLVLVLATLGILLKRLTR